MRTKILPATAMILAFSLGVACHGTKEAAKGKDPRDREWH
jgi:hypothetical protein